MISRRHFFGMTAGLASASWVEAQDTQRPTVFKVKVDMVVLSFTVTDSHGKYVNGLKPTEFKIFEDGILQKVNTFAEGAKPPVMIADDGSVRALEGQTVGESGKSGLDARTDAFVGTNVFVLFDTSKFKYPGF